MSNNLPNSNNSSSQGSSSGGKSSSPLEPVRQDVKVKVDKILNK